MKSGKNHITYIILVLIFLLFFTLYNISHTETLKTETIRDFPEIISTQTLNVVTSSNFIDYFVYNGVPMGFFLEILEDFSSYYNLKLKIILENNFSGSVQLLKNRDCDIYACNTVIPKYKVIKFRSTLPIRKTKYVLVQRKPDYYWLMTDSQIEDSLIKDIREIKNEKIYTNDPNAFYLRLNIPSIEIIDSISMDQIIKNISNKTFSYAISDYASAQVLKSYYNNLDLSTVIRDNNDIVWYVRNESVALIDSLNNWLSNFKKSKKYYDLENKYIYQNRMIVNLKSEYYSGNEGKISIYDDLIKEYSKNINWDWRLLASLIYEESRFDPNAESWAGAIGLMQLMPYTYKEFSNDTTWEVTSQLSAGTKYINYLSSLVPANIKDSVTGIKMILAGYNIGFGHVEDAIRLAEKYEKDSASWDDISYFLINLTNQKYYNDSVVKFGYFPGIYAVDFANSIYDRFLHYKNVIPE